MGRDNQQAVSYDARCLAVGRGIHGPEEIKIGPRQRQTVAPTSCDAILVAGFARPSARCASLAERSFGRMTRSVAARALCPLRYRAGRTTPIRETNLVYDPTEAAGEDSPPRAPCAITVVLRVLAQNVGSRNGRKGKSKEIYIYSLCLFA